MAEDKVTKADLEKKVAEQEKEIEALKLVNEAGGEEKAAPRESLSDKDRTFAVTLVDPDKKKKKVKAQLQDVSKVYVSGKRYSQKEFMKDKEAQEKAVAAKHVNIKILK